MLWIELFLIIVTTKQYNFHKSTVGTSIATLSDAMLLFKAKDSDIKKGHVSKMIQNLNFLISGSSYFDTPVGPDKSFDDETSPKERDA